MNISGSVRKITYYNQSNGYTVIRIEVTNKEMDRIIEETGLEELYSNYITVVSMFTTLPFIDETYDFTGDFEESKYGIQFRSNKTVKSLKQNEEGIISYLSSSMFKGIGKKTAKKIFDKLGENALKLIIEDKDNLKGLGIKKDKIEEIYSTLVSSYRAEEDLVEMLSLGLSLKMATRIIKSLKKKALRTVKENPYLLIEKVEGIGFLRADAIALNVGIKKDSPYRIKALIMYVLNEVTYNRGDTYLHSNDLYLECEKIANEGENILNKDNYETYLNELKEEKKVIIDEDNNVFDLRLSFYESEVARYIFDILNSSNYTNYTRAKVDTAISDTENSLNISYNDKQREAICNALMEPITIVTGGPGTGKSTIIRGIIETYVRMFPTEKQDFIKERMLLLAPTGRAAKRLRELSFHSASTIHKALGYQGTRFEVELLDYDLIIIDEFSMVDINLAYHLFKAIKPETKVIIVGDADQLPAVGAGDILNDLIISKEITCTKLTKIHRQSEESTIIELAHSINEGALPYDLDIMQHDRKLIKCNDENIIPLTIKTVELYLEKQRKIKEESAVKLNTFHQLYNNLPEKVDMLVNDVQVLVPMYRGSVGIDAFNYKMQEIFNPLTVDYYKQISFGTKRFRLYDKVIQLVNRPDKDIMNGDIGYVSKILGEDNNYEGLYVQYLSNEVFYEIDELEEISLAYAISIHKAQGSEFRTVIVPFSFKYYIMLKKKLIYTAVTRAKNFLIMIGNFEALRKGIITIEEKRKTKLQEKLKALIGNPIIEFKEETIYKEVLEEKAKEELIGDLDEVSEDFINKSKELEKEFASSETPYTFKECDPYDFMN